jgi:hypothetical protein
MSEHYYAWVRVGDGEPEPAAIRGDKPNRTATTIGCPDTFNVDDPESGCSIVLVADRSERFTNPHWAAIYGRAQEVEIEFEIGGCREVTRIEADEREKAYRRAIKERPHSYAGFGRGGPP